MHEIQLKQAIDEGVKAALPGLIKEVASSVISQFIKEQGAEKKEILEFFKAMKSKLSVQSRYVALNLIAHSAPKAFISEYIKDQALREAKPLNKELI